MDNSRIMTTRELAEYMKLNEKTILKMAQNNKIPGIKIGNQWRFHLESIDQHLQKDIVQYTPKDELDLIIKTSEQITPLSRLVEEPLIVLDMKAEDNEGVLNELAQIAADAGIVSDAKKLFKQLKRREWMLSTAVGNGVAIPHPRNPKPELFSKPSVVVAVSKKGIDFSSPDGKPVHVFFMTCAPDVFAHLRILAKISKFLKTEDVVGKFVNAAEKQDLITTMMEIERGDSVLS